MSNPDKESLIERCKEEMNRTDTEEILSNKPRYIGLAVIKPLQEGIFSRLCVT